VVFKIVGSILAGPTKSITGESLSEFITLDWMLERYMRYYGSHLFRVHISLVVYIQRVFLVREILCQLETGWMIC